MTACAVIQESPPPANGTKTPSTALSPWAEPEPAKVCAAQSIVPQHAASYYHAKLPFLPT